MKCFILRGPAVRPFRLAVLASLVSAALLGSASADTFAVPPFDGGQVVSRHAGTRALAAAEIAGIRAWLEAHRTGWHFNLATPPVAEVTIGLSAASQPPAIVLSLWPSAPDADWRRSILIEEPGAGSPQVRTLSAKDETALLGFAR